MNRPPLSDTSPPPSGQPEINPLVQQRLARIRRVARALDSQFHIPLTSIRVGFDSIVGLIPGIGDVATAAISIWIIVEAYRAGASSRTLIRMIANTLLDTFGGGIPVVGDLFDVYWKSNLKNAQLLEDDLNQRPSSKE